MWLCLLEDLLKELENQDNGGDVPAENFQLYEKAKTMVKEMEDKNFTPEMTAAKKESDEAKKCMTVKSQKHLIITRVFWILKRLNINVK